MFKILSATTSVLLEKEAAKYNISELGSLTISNGNYHLAFIGVLKETPRVIPEETPKKPAPKTRAKRTPKSK